MPTETSTIWSAVAAIAAAVSAGASLIAIRIQAKSVRRTQSVDVWLRMEEIFESENMLLNRAKASAALRDNDLNSDAIETVLDFFDSLGYLVKTDVIDAVLVWHSFQYWVSHYAEATRGIVEAARKDDETLWRDFVWLADRVAKIQLRERDALDALISAEDLRRFFDSEIAPLQRLMRKGPSSPIR